MKKEYIKPLKEIFESYEVFNKWNVSEIEDNNYDYWDILQEIVDKIPTLESEIGFEWDESDILWHIYNEIDTIEVDIMRWRNQWGWGFTIN